MKSMPMTKSTLDSLPNNETVCGSIRRSVAMTLAQPPSCQPNEEDAKDLASLIQNLKYHIRYFEGYIISQNNALAMVELKWA